MKEGEKKMQKDLKHTLLFFLSLKIILLKYLLTFKLSEKQ